jgi:carbohydrate-selective porin OprB
LPTEYSLRYGVSDAGRRDSRAPRCDACDCRTRRRRRFTDDLTYVAETFTAHGHTELLDHGDAALTLDTKDLWGGGKLFVLGQINRGSGINHDVGSVSSVSNLESDGDYAHIGELFFEQSVAEVVTVRVGKQDANRDFGTPRYGGNFINNNFGMFPTTPLPSYPTTAFGVAIDVRPVPWLYFKAAGYDDSIYVGGVGVIHHYGPADRHEGITSFAVWQQRQATDGVDPMMPRTFASDTGWIFQNDEHIYLHPENDKDVRGLNVIFRLGWAQADRTQISRFGDISIAWHGLGARDNDTIGVGVAAYTVGTGDEQFVETFYKLRLTQFVSLQPDVEYYRHPGGLAGDALIAGGRLKLKL